MMPIVARSFQNQEKAQERLEKASSKWIEADRKCLLLPGIKELMAASLVEALRQGTQGPAYEGALFGRPWGFQLEEIKFPKIFLWHGEADQQIPVTIARALAEKIPNCKATYYPNEGHISLIVKHAQDILTALQQ
jgi:pimeloyl-ACP methyl ester carboxylesterase